MSEQGYRQVQVNDYDRKAVSEVYSKQRKLPEERRLLLKKDDEAAMGEAYARRTL